MANEPIFPNIQEAVETDENIVTEIDSYCVNCGETGITRMLLTEIPFFKQVVVISFHCDHCHFHNNELQPAQKIAAKGIRYELKVTNVKDLSRQVVKTEWAQVKIPEIDFEVKQQSGLITTVEGILDRAINGLKHTYDVSDGDEEDKAPLKLYIEKMEALKTVSQCFTIIIEDISGNSFVENLVAPEPDPQLETGNFIRTIEDDKLLGIYQSDELENNDEKDVMKNEVLQFSTNCPHCNAPCFTNMKLTRIPHFKEVIIMATNCDVCGTRTNEIKSGAGIEDKGVRITIDIENEDDLMKEVVRSDTCNIFVPQLNLKLYSTGSGRYTTVQGLSHILIENLERSNPFIDGDSSREDVRAKINDLTRKLENLIGLTIILDDPCGNSFVDGATNVERYQRTWEQNEELGINDMRTDSYTTDGKAMIPEEDEENEQK
ncbi:hypothetical protein RDWZM_008490 [Blomia tropicalis]|uniref:Zinc finger ZPR1-type domain-containing protein n=1 Tax=Blomia tropicalis TaxID=40697 RepID=A0A9Q0M270_BLOTA|nr:nucleolar zinc-finger protein [Blomia tropicalis]KAJ6217333.1 hypothetical protein RDWZM_008490 [Blomia tropicalis]